MGAFSPQQAKGVSATNTALWEYDSVKTTLDLPDELVHAAKIRAAKEGRRLKDVVADLLRRGLAEEPKSAGRMQRKVRLPLVECAHDARREREMTPKRMADALAQEDAKAVRQRS